MRLLFVIDHFGSGGAQRQLVTLAAGLHQRGHVVELFIYQPEYLHFAPTVESLGMTVHRFKKTRKYSVNVVIELARLLRRGNYDAVLAFLSTPSLYAELASVLVGRVPLVVSERFMYTSLTRPMWLLQQAHRLASHITVNSHHQRERMAAMFPWMKSKLSTVYNGVDLDTFHPAQELTGSTNADGPTVEPPRFLAVGNTAPKKNAIILVGAMLELRQRGFPLPFVAWAGVWSNTEEDARAKAAVDAALGTYDLTDQWTWLGERHDVAQLMREYDALVHPAYLEGLPNAVCESLASGLPVLVSDVCDHPRLVENGVTGFLFDPHDEHSVANAMMRFARLSRPQRATMGARAREFAERVLSLDVYVRSYEDLFVNVRWVRGRHDRADREALKRGP